MSFKASRPWLGLIVCLLIAVFFLAYPLYIIYPFRYQSPVQLKFALRIVQLRPYVGILLSALAVVFAVWCWRRHTRMVAKVAAAFVAVCTLAVAILSRINVYELMFHPSDQPSFAAADKTKLDGGEQVIAIQVGQAARAYPIRVISYHHIVNDTVGGLPVVATY